MTSRDFCYWLQGYFEIARVLPGTGCQLGNEQVQMIQKHLALVFKHEIDPSYPNQGELNKIHSGTGDATLRC